jgi:predicted nucleotidyltransferase
VVADLPLPYRRMSAKTGLEAESADPSLMAAAIGSTDLGPSTAPRTLRTMNPALRSAVVLARTLKSEREVVAACVLGSVARGDDDPHSDLDILAVIDDASDNALLQRTRGRVPASLSGHPVQVRAIRRGHLADLVERRTLFAAHLAREARVVFDRKRDLKRARRLFERDPRVDESPAELRGRLGPYEELSWCRGHYVICLSDLYMLGRSGAMLALAKQGIFRFGRRDVFAQHSLLFPELSSAARTLSALEPFYMRVRRGFNAPLPFAPRNTHREAEQARDACRTLLDAIP